MACLVERSCLVLAGVLAAALLAGCHGGGDGGGSSRKVPPGKTFGGSGDDYGFSVQQTVDGGYVVAGATHY